jgi:hypothetical protein
VKRRKTTCESPGKPERPAASGEDLVFSRKDLLLAEFGRAGKHEILRRHAGRASSDADERSIVNAGSGGRCHGCPENDLMPGADPHPEAGGDPAHPGLRRQALDKTPTLRLFPPPPRLIPPGIAQHPFGMFPRCNGLDAHRRMHTESVQVGPRIGDIAALERKATRREPGSLRKNRQIRHRDPSGLARTSIEPG